MTYELAMANAESRLVLGDLETGNTLLVDAPAVHITWSPDRAWLAVDDFHGIWLVDAHDGTVHQIELDRKAVVSWLSWSPASRKIAFWMSAEDNEGLGLHFYDRNSGELRRIEGTDAFDCNYGIPAWSFDEAWLVFSAMICGDSGNSQRYFRAVRVDGVSTIDFDGYRAGIPVPSPTDYLFVFQVFNEDTQVREIYAVDLNSPDVLPWRLADPAGRQLVQPLWDPNGEYIYAETLDWYRPEIMRVNPRDGSIREVVHGVGGHWAPNVPRIAYRDAGNIVVLDLRSGETITWGADVSDICGYYWTSQGDLDSLLVCHSSGDLPLFQVQVVHSDGRTLRIGSELYGQTWLCSDLLR